VGPVGHLWLLALDTNIRAAIEELRGIPQEGIDCDAVAAREEGVNKACVIGGCWLSRAV